MLGVIRIRVEQPSKLGNDEGEMMQGLTAGLGRTWTLAAGAIIVLALVLRLAFLGEPSFWLDEAWSLWFARHSLDYLWTVMPTYETHPPVYYSILHFWRVFGESETALRSLSVLFSMGVVIMAVLLGKEAEKDRPVFVMLLTGAILAASPVQIEFAQEARPYSALCFTVALLLWGGARLAKAPERAGRLLWREPGLWAPVAAGLILTPWFHYVGLFYAFAFGLFLLYVWLFEHRFAWRFLVNVAAVGLLALLIYTPQFLTMLNVAGQWNQGTWLEKPQLWSMVAVLQDLVAVNTGNAPRALGYGVMLLGVLAAAAGALRLWLRGSTSIAVLLVSVAAVPFAMTLLISLISTPMFMLRVLTPSQAPIVVLIAVALAAIPRKPIGYALAGVALAAFLASFFATNFRRDDEPWRKVAAEVTSRVKPGDLVMVVPNEATLPFDIYYRPPPGVGPRITAPFGYLMTEKNQRPLGASTGIPQMSPQIAEGLALQAASYPGSVFVVYRWDAMFDPNDILDKTLRRTRPLQTVITHDAEVKIYGPPQIAAPQPAG